MSLIASALFCAAALPAFAAAPAKPGAAKAAPLDPALRGMSVPDLMTKLYRTRGEKQMGVISELARRGPEADKIILSEYGTHEATVQMLFSRKGPEAMPRLIALQKDPQYVSAAGAALIALASPACRAHAAQLLACAKQMPEYQYCGMALARSMSPASASFAPKLLSALSDKSAAVRGFAATALGQIGPEAAQDPKVVPALAGRLGDKDANVTWAAAVALRKMGRRAASAVPVLEKAAQSSDHELQRQAQEALKALKR